jgi:hypothetical protein
MARTDPATADRAGTWDYRSAAPAVVNRPPDIPIVNLVWRRGQGCHAAMFAPSPEDEIVWSGYFGTDLELPHRYVRRH